MKAVLSAMEESAQAADEHGLGLRKVHNHGSEGGSCSAVSQLELVLTCCGHISVPLGWLEN